MCGIVGYISREKSDLGAKLADRLKRLEYRGYDSAGVVVIQRNRDKASLNLIKTTGDLNKLQERLLNKKTYSNIGLAHTRWATHGLPSERNALPIATIDGSMVIVFNGIVENNFELREELSGDGQTFNTDNDAETLLLWIAKHFRGNLSLAVRTALLSVKGRYAFALLRTDCPQTIVVAKNKSPLVIGRNDHGYAIASDVAAIQDDVDEVFYPEDGVVALVEASHLIVTNLQGVSVKSEFTSVPKVDISAHQGSFDSYTLQEISTQPESLIASYRAAVEGRETLMSLAPTIDRVSFVGCGSAYHAGLIGKAMVERFAKVGADANIASEYHIGSPIIDKNTLAVFMSQSGETADTLVCLELAKSRGALIVVIGNVATSTMARLADIYLPLACGPEIGVASTKAYTAMLMQVVFFALALGIGRGVVSTVEWSEHDEAAKKLPLQIDKILGQRSHIQKLARSLRQRRNFSFVGRDVFYPTALEGALKLRELSYRNSEGFGGGELKHGTLALIEHGYPVIAIAPRVASTAKMIGNIQEVKSRGAKVIGIISEDDRELQNICDDVIAIPATLPAFLPILSVVPVQLFAYELAKTLGRNIDRPRNLAKSLTVE